MNVGTKSLLFGVHQFVLHPWYVLRAWRILYGRWPELHELAAIVTHDWGYWGSPDVEGESGLLHPRRPANWWGKRFRSFGPRVASEIMGHSRSYPEHDKERGHSRLCWADKLATALYPRWLYLMLAKLTGELSEYMGDSQHKPVAMVSGQDPELWLLEVRARCTLAALEGAQEFNAEADHGVLGDQIG